MLEVGVQSDVCVTGGLHRHRSQQQASLDSALFSPVLYLNHRSKSRMVGVCIGAQAHLALALRRCFSTPPNGLNVQNGLCFGPGHLADQRSYPRYETRSKMLLGFVNGSRRPNAGGEVDYRRLIQASSWSPKLPHAMLPTWHLRSRLVCLSHEDGRPVFL
jgi:hypothetical protein